MPRRGSLQFKPRKRAKREIPRIRSWTKETEPRLQGFPLYKAFMTHMIVLDNYKNSPTFGKEISIPVTILEAPSVRIFSIRAYKRDPVDGYLKVAKELYYLKDVNKRLYQRLTLPKEFKEKDFEKAFSDLESEIDQYDDLRVLVYTNVEETGFPKKTPDVVECFISGTSPKDKLDFVKNNIDKAIKFSDMYKEKEYVDVFAVTKGKGYEGPVKRWGKKIQKRKHKLQGVARHIGAVSPRGPQRVLWTVPLPGQLGYHTRCEYNKLIVKISDEPNEINPKSGIPHYGLIKTQWVALYGSVPGPSKRLIRIRPAIRPYNTTDWLGKIIYTYQESLI